MRTRLIGHSRQLLVPLRRQLTRTILRLNLRSRKRAARNRRIGKNEVSLLWMRTRFARGCGFAQASHQRFPAWPPLVHLRTQKSLKIARDGTG